MIRAMLFTAALLLSTSGAGAQNTSPSTSSSSPPSTVGAAPSVPSPGRAPVGHRQPTLSDLPPTIAREEKANDLDMRQKALEGNLDKQLRICNGC